MFEIESSLAGGRELVTTTNNQQPLLPNLQYLELQYMDSISHVWKCSNWKKILILQKQFSFQNLTTIFILGCKRIKYLFSPLMAKLLLNLKKIDIVFCEGMEEVVSRREYKDEAMTTTNKTTTFFPHLHSLSFKGLTNLKRIGGGVSAKSSTGITTHDQFEVFFYMLLCLRGCLVLRFQNKLFVFKIDFVFSKRFEKACRFMLFQNCILEADNHFFIQSLF
ncbi:hypothetical protein HanXRQr2_Chr14g0620501 [Helianthus annuus]|uniref:Disease resistance protein At4g27190-like leucine-rich repeats domain-containing protein n=2 Tax=Helianthus annuus TaxID=4232 RepID=A0A9K3E6K9_HELAN|nr:hypothetical protein HanXRQr2_Chr14g0620501 [Helianthus annuus]